MQIIGEELTITLEGTEGRWEIIGQKRMEGEDFYLLSRTDIHKEDACILIDGEGNPIATDLEPKFNQKLLDLLNDYYPASRDRSPEENRPQKTEYLPVYPHDYSYAVDHGEEAEFWESRHCSFDCKKAIENSIADHFDGMYLDAGAAAPVLEKFGAERVGLVLAVTVEVKFWEERFFSDDRKWADAQTDLSLDGGDKLTASLAVNCHPALVEDFLAQFRKETEVLQMDMPAFRITDRESRVQAEKKLFEGPESEFGIYQIRKDSRGEDYRYMYMDYVEQAGLKVKGEDYDLVYTARLAPWMDLGYITRRFNMNIPADFSGHPLSVSDVVILNDEGQKQAFYLDRAGYYGLDDFIRDRQKTMTGERKQDREPAAQKERKCDPEAVKKESPGRLR